MNFQETLATHLDAVRRRDLDAFLATVARGDKVTVILPNGGRVAGRDNVEEFHSAWFADPEWRMETSLLHTVETEAMALALLFVEYDDRDHTGNPYHLSYYLSLVFQQIDGEWLLVHDQNTLAPEA